MPQDFNTKLNRVMIGLAALRPTQKELNELKDLMHSMDSVGFFNFIRDLERELTYEIQDSSLLNRLFVTHNQSSLSAELVSQLNDIRTRDLKQPVPKFANEMLRVIRDSFPNSDPPEFDRRKGFRDWVDNLLRSLSASEVYQAASILRERKLNINRPWPINSK